MLQTEKINFDLFGKSGVEITPFLSEDGEQVFRLRWNDYVINEWIEVHNTLAEALVRVGVLAKCVEEDLGLTDTVVFARRVEEFLDNNTEGDC